MKKILLLCLFAIGFGTAKAQSVATWYTSKGSFKTVLRDTLTPIAVDSFIARVAEKFYDGLIFHRVINNFMIQGGDPLGTGFGGPGYSFPDEFHPTLKNTPGALAMANSGPNTNGSQFFINLVTNSHLNNVHTVFGMVTDSFTVVQAIGLVPTTASDKPITDVVIDSIRITNLYSNTVKSAGATFVASVFPNPCRGILHVSLPVTATNVSLLNIQGKTIYSTQASGNVEIDVQKLPVGLYIVKLSNETGYSEHKIIVQ